MSCVPCSWRHCWVVFVLLICFLRIAKVSNTKQCLWQFLAVFLKTMHTLAVQHDAVYCWGHWIPLETQRKYRKITTELMGNNSEDHKTSAPWLLHLDLLFTSVYRQGIDRECATCLGLLLHLFYRLFSPETEEAQWAQPVFSSSLPPAEPAPFLLHALQLMGVRYCIYSTPQGGSQSLLPDLKTRWSDLSG